MISATVSEHVVLVNTNTVSLPRDPFTTGIPYMPLSLAYLAAALQHAGIALDVLDAFGEAPWRMREEGRFLVQGLSPEEVAERLPEHPLVVFVYAGTVAAHVATLALISAIRGRLASPIIVLENTQAVTSYHLRPVAAEFFRAGASAILLGEAEERGPELVRRLQADQTLDEIPGLLIREGEGMRDTGAPSSVPDLDTLAAPAWELFPLQSYWRIRYAHGPMQSRYLPLLTSRGCPYPCRFCVIPTLSNRRWRPRSASNVVDEMAAMQQRFGVSEFHVEDLNPTVSESRVQAICAEILARGLCVTWKISAGTKIETIKDPRTIEQMAEAGCRYLSLSPESGSPRVLQLMDKPFDHAHALRLVEKMAACRIRTQACFVLGFPGERAEDRRLTTAYVRSLVRAGLDEIALFIMTPVPGSSIYGQVTGFDSLSELNFSPGWRRGYALLSRYRMGLYGRFLWWKCRAHPVRIVRQSWNFFRRRFETKMEMTPYRA